MGTSHNGWSESRFGISVLQIVFLAQLLSPFLNLLYNTRSIARHIWLSVNVRNKTQLCSKGGKAHTGSWQMISASGRVLTRASASMAKNLVWTAGQLNLGSNYIFASSR
jgi:hypothetical protein